MQHEHDEALPQDLQELNAQRKRRLVPITSHHRIECPVWHRPHFDITALGIAWKCRSCKSTTHLTTWEEVDRARAEVTMEG